MPLGDPVPGDNPTQLYQLTAQVGALEKKVEQQQRTIDALIASIPQLTQPTIGAPTGGRNNSGGKVYREWVSWLQLNRPAYRQQLMDGVGKPLPGNQPVLDWKSIMATWPDAAVQGDTLCKMNGQSTGQGRPPTIYFLWSQRFDVYGEFGVGPSERPTTVASEPEVLLGVIHPPTESQSNEIVAQPQVLPEVTLEPETPEYERFGSMEEWAERWNPVFDETAPYDAQPTDEEKVAMRATLPEDTGGEPWNVILTRSYQEAKVRSRS